MKGLDNWITGANDPSAPFNQIDLEDKYPYLLPHCLWITDEMFEDDYSTLEDAFDLVISNEETIGLNNPYNKIDWEIQDVSKLSNQIEKTFNELKCLKNDKKI
jgi:hypothetical protein